MGASSRNTVVLVEAVFVIRPRRERNSVTHPE
jgi:hypothetical protein